MPKFHIRHTVIVGDDSLLSERIVDAKNEARAVKHIVADSIKIERLTVEHAMRLAQEGVKVEQAA